MSYVRNCWYAIAWSTEIGASLGARRLMGIQEGETAFALISNFDSGRLQPRTMEVADLLTSCGGCVGRSTVGVLDRSEHFGCRAFDHEGVLGRRE